MTLAATATLEDVAAEITGTATPGLRRATVASAATLALSGTASVGLRRATVASVATLAEGNTGQLLATLRRAGVASTGTLSLSGAATLTLRPLTTTAAGEATLTGGLTANLARMSVTASGVLTALEPIAGSFSATLRRMRSASTSVVRQPPTGEVFARQQPAIPTVAFDQPPTGWPQWLREIAQSINLMSSWVGTSTTPGGGNGGGAGSGTVTSVTAGVGLVGAPNPITETGTLSLSVPVTVARGGTGAVSHNVDAVLVGTGTAALRSSGASVDATGNVTAPGDFWGRSFSSEGATLAGGFWWREPGDSAWWAWYADSGVAHLSGSSGGSDVLRVTAAGAITAPYSLTAGTATAPAGGTLAGDINGQRILLNGVPVGTGGGSGTITGVTAGTGLTGGGTSGTVALNLSTPVAIANGGTNATTAAAALANLGGAPLASPAFTGVPTAPTPISTTNSTQIATTAFVKDYAPLFNPALTGTPTAPTAISGANTTQIATTAFVKSLNYAPLASPAFTGAPTAPTPISSSNSTQIATTAFVNDYAPLSSPALTGTPTAPTAITGTNTTQIATTAFVKSLNYLTANQTITLSGDVTGSGTAAITTQIAAGAVGTTEIANSAVTYAKIQNVAANRLLGNSTGGAAAPSEIALPLAVALGGTNAAALAVNNGGATWGLTTTLLQTTGSAVAPVSDAGGTIGAGAGGTLYLLGAGTAGTIDLARANGTFASPTAVLSGETLGQFLFDGTYAGSWDAAPRGLIQCNATENWTSAANGTRFTITTTTTGTLTGVTRLTLGPGLQIGAPTGGDKGAGTINATIVHANGTVLTSDADLKRDIGALPKCLPLVEAIEPRSYRWCEPEDQDTVPPGWAERTRWGFIAQDVEHILRHHEQGVVDVGPDGVRGLSFGDMTAMLWQALRELSKEVDILKGPQEHSIA